MDIVFDRGSKSGPRGHALLYFTNSSNPDEIWATYVVVLPITVDVSKYVPPFLMNQMGEIGPQDLSAFAFPPAPEKVEGYGYIQGLAEGRDDDIIYGGSLNPGDISSAMMSVNEAVQRYAGMYSETREAQQAQKVEAQAPEELPGFGVNEVLYGLMSDSDKLSELTKLVGRLRYAVEGGEKGLAQEAENDIDLLANHMPEGHRIPEMVAAAKSGDSRGAKLADLYLQRCFHLIQQEHEKLGQVEEEIKALESGEGA